VPLTDGRTVPLFSDGDFCEINLYDPTRRTFVVKFLEARTEVRHEFTGNRSSPTGPSGSRRLGRVRRSCGRSRSWSGSGARQSC
jgi:hypothetical protein